MDTKTLHVLEYDKICARLKGFCDFSASMELALSLEPTNSYDLALASLAETTKARKLFSVQDIGVGGAHDIRKAVAEVVAEIARSFKWDGPIGIGFPAPIKAGVAMMAANVLGKW